VRTVLGIRGRDGAFAEYVSLPAANLHAVPDSLDDVEAVFIEPTAAACRVIEQVGIDAGTRAAVIGAGRLGLLVAQVLREQGAPVTVVVRGNGGAMAGRALGLETVTVDRARSLARGFDVAVDATGSPDGFAIAAALVRPRGTIVIKSTFHGVTGVPFAPLVIDEITMVGSRCGPFARAIELLVTGRVNVKPLVSAVYPIEQFAQAFEHAGRALKVILRNDGRPGSRTAARGT
jgi:threonine dehydrogenase-like Zn-dependent dehydrogenase